MKIEKLEILGFDWALEAMRMPHQSCGVDDNSDIILAKKLITAGRSHRKFLRQLTVQMKISASMAFFFEMDTYKIGVVSNSSSFWFTKGKRLLSIDDFVIPANNLTEIMQSIIDIINDNRYIPVEYLRYIVPQGIEYTRIMTFTGEALFNIIQQRHNHRLQEWKTFVNMCFDLMLPREKEIFELALKKEKP